VPRRFRLAGLLGFYMTNRLVKMLENGRIVVRGLSRRGIGVEVQMDRDESLPISVDWSGWLGSDTIASVTNAATGASVSAESNTTDTVSFTLSGKGTGYLDSRITTSSGKIKELRVFVANKDAGSCATSTCATSSASASQAISSFEAGLTRGFIDYNDTSGVINLTADVWASIPNNGLGAFTNKAYAPQGVTELMNTSTGQIDPTQLDLGDAIFIRNDFTITPAVNNTGIDVRYTLGSGLGAYELPGSAGRLDRGAGIGYRFSKTVDYIYMGDENTRGNFITLQVKCTGAATLVNAGSVIEVARYGG
jgi:hypothetical protein